ncbi:hypothetical protein ACLI4Z_02900 [Natrialbaceae archaeon A-arb3/5]
MSGEHSQARAVWNAVYDRIEDDLRVVIRYGPKDATSVMRDDVRATYSSTESQAVVDQTIVSQLSYSRHEETFKAGELDAVVRVFENAWIVAYPDAPDRKSGVLVSIERDSDRASMSDVEWCIRYLEDELDLKPPQ